MEYLNELLEKKNMSQLILVILFIIYLIMGFKTPDSVATLIDSGAGKIVVALVALLLFAYSNPILGVLGIFVAFHLIKSASIKTGMAALEEFFPTEQKKWSPFTKENQFPYTLEQEVVKKMAPQKFNTNYVKASYKPMLEDTYDAAHVNLGNN
jgi:hypothetical protein